MTGTNHAVAGAVIAAAVTQPVLALPLALISHFVMDALPHYGDSNKKSWLNRHFSYVLFADLLLGLTFLGALALLKPANWDLMLLCAMVAALPDAVWVRHYIADLKGAHAPMGRFATFSKRIQWGERPWGIYVEIVWLLASLAVLYALVR